MTTETLPATQDSQAALLERVIIGGDLARLSATDRVNYYRAVCQSVGLNPLTKPFDYIVLNGKLTLYATKTATDQLRSIKSISIDGAERDTSDPDYATWVVSGHVGERSDTEIGSVFIAGLKGDARANAIMKALTKAKRRLTLSLAGLGWLDEVELETVPSAQRADVDPETGEIREGRTLRQEIAERKAEVTEQAADKEAATDGAAPVTPPAGAASDPSPAARNAAPTSGSGTSGAQTSSPVRNDSAVTSAATTPAGMVQCESRSPLDPEIQCRREQGHPGVHKTTNESWSDPK